MYTLYEMNETNLHVVICTFVHEIKLTPNDLRGFKIRILKND